MVGLVTQYLGAGTIADRPTTPDIIDGAVALYFAVDEGGFYLWKPPVDPDPGVWVAANPLLPSSADPGLYAWDADAQAYTAIVIPDTSGFLTDAPSDGSEYVRKDGDWVESTGGGGVVLPDLTGQGGKYLKVKDDESGVEWDTPAGGGGGGGADIFALIRQAMADHATPSRGDGSNITFKIETDREVALCQFLYTSSGVFVAGADYTIPTGKVAFLTFFDYNTNTRNDPTYYKVRCFNVTTNTVVADSAVGANAGFSGLFYPDNANAPTPFPKPAGVAGDTIRIDERSAGDGNYRTINGYFILTLADA